MVNSKKFLWIFFIAVVTSITSIGLIYAQELGSATVIYYKGKVLAKKDGVSGYRKVSIGLKLEKNDSIKTGRNSTCDLSIDNRFDRIVTLDENTQIDIKDLILPRLGMQKGRVFVLFEGLPEGSSFKVETPVAVAGIRGSGMIVEGTSNNLLLEAHAGNVFIYGLDKNKNPIGEKNVPAGYGCSAGLFQPPSGLAPLGQQNKDKWNEWIKSISKHITIFLQSILDAGQPEDIEDWLKKLEQRWQERIESLDRDRIEHRIKQRDRPNTINGPP